jgi:hypothetical protein
MRSRFLLTLLLACGTAQASEWVSVATGHQGKQELLVDVSSIRIAGEIRRAWVKTVYALHSRNLSDNPNKWAKQVVSREAFNCADETARDEAFTIYYEDGTIDAPPADAFPTQWKPVTPDTMQSAKMLFICAWKQK